MAGKTIVVKFPRKHDVDITRNGPWGNPYYIGRDGTREEVIEKFRVYGITRGLDIKAARELKNKVLGCWCKPLACHGDILAMWANTGEVE